MNPVVYLIANPRQAPYIGYTINPTKRLRRHNQEIAGGAKRTRHRGPWRFIRMVSGFPTKTAAQAFEWAWQHPFRTLKYKEVLKTVTGKPYSLTRRIREVEVMVAVTPGLALHTFELT